jgi:hypothetical protein
MGSEARRRRRAAWSHTLLHWRASDLRPRPLYRQCSQRFSNARSEVLLRVLLMTAYVVFMAIVGGIGALVVLVMRNAALGGFVAGVITAAVFLMLALGYVGLGGFLDWLDRRQTH